MNKLDRAETYGRFLKAAQKWLDYQKEEDPSIPPEILDMAFHQSTANAIEVIGRLGLKEESAVEFLTAWSQIVLFASFMAGWLTATKRGFENIYYIQDIESSHPTDSPNDLFRGALNFDKDAKLYAIDLTVKLFDLLRAVPAVLLSGFADHEVALLKRCTEASLYSGFLTGAEFCYRHNPNAKTGLVDMSWALLDSGHSQ